MVKKSSAGLKTDLKERKDNFDLRVKTLEKAEDRIMKKLKGMQPRLREMMKK